MKKQLFFITGLISLLLLMFFFPACHSLLGGNSEGIIEYKITYPDTFKNNFMSSMMPDKMVMKFKKDKAVSELKAGMGMVTTDFLVDHKKRTLTELVKIMTQKYAVSLDSAAVRSKLMQHVSMKFNFTKETKEIAGYKCKKVIGTDTKNCKYEIYYTEKIKIKDPNWGTPFDAIPGVLLEYQIINNNIMMTLSAINVSKEKIDDAEFEIPQGFNNIREDELPQYLKNFL